MIEPERLRYAAIDYEYYICFEHKSRDEFIEDQEYLFSSENRKIVTPEKAFLDTYSHWTALKEDEVYERYEGTYGIDFYQDMYKEDARTLTEFKKEYNKKIKDIRLKAILNA